MKEKNKLYKIRRKLQVLATKITSYEFMSKVYFLIKFKKKLNLKNPKTFNEKIQWLKLNNFPYNEKVINCTDKYKVRQYIKTKGQEKHLNNLIGVWDEWEEIDWDRLPNKFVLKCTHGCGYNIICNDKSKLDKNIVREKIKKWMSEDFSLYNAEQHYTFITPKIICEEYLGDDIVDYKFFCFHGKPEFFYIAQGFGRGINERMDFFNMDGSKTDFGRKDYNSFSEKIKFPNKFEEMVEVSKILAEDFPFVRVDFFEINNKIIFSELTFTPGGGLMDIYPQKYDRIIGDLIDLDLVK